ncbi:hypothetical protein FNF29_04765 [Cafeteria roenbergensis]|uniref:protein-tyrosine-phosphatase n=1 Tax=Cafeteria roenbergensis TaxID=33653 RepID=A0A5A8CGN1_CAFRO|nr:hypothetical protein FNF29_04765 [Cafeteria roenbergensis]|eukprot:KAA0151290.1 hypothetical protein FNF29_04765 [Cafeteria roenbergensis]
MDDSHPLVRELEDGLAAAAEALAVGASVSDGVLGHPVSLIHDALTFEVRVAEPTPRAGVVFVSVDDFLRYTPFFADYGPPNLGKVYRFCEAVDAALQQVWEAGSGRVVAWCTDQPHRRTNAAVMAGAYLVLRCGFSADDAYTPFVGMRPAPLAMRDAAFGLCTFTLTLLDCLRGLDAARRQGIFAWETFDIASYEHDEQLSNGDLNWIVPGLFIAFSGPLDTVKRLADGRTTWHPRQYREFFRRNGVAAVVRLNKTCYDKSTFTRAGIAHYDLFFPDGGLAPPEILERFMHIAETTRGAVGVHCKAGLGRTGTCIGAHMMKHFRMTGREVIAWLRICRPGSVLGPQQQYLERLEPQMWRLGAEQGLPAGSRRRIGQIPRPLDLASPPLTPARSGEGAPATDGVHTPGHGRAVMPWPIRANRGGASGDSAPMGAPTPSASTAQGVEVDSMMSPGGSSHMQAHLVPRRGATASVGTEQEARAQAASGPGGFAPDARRTRSSRALGSRSRDSPLHRA